MEFSFSLPTFLKKSKPPRNTWLCDTLLLSLSCKQFSWHQLSSSSLSGRCLKSKRKHPKTRRGCLPSQHCNLSIGMHFISPNVLQYTMVLMGILETEPVYLTVPGEDTPTPSIAVCLGRSGRLPRITTQRSCWQTSETWSSKVCWRFRLPYSQTMTSAWKQSISGRQPLDFQCQISPHPLWSQFPSFFSLMNHAKNALPATRTMPTPRAALVASA